MVPKVSKRSSKQIEQDAREFLLRHFPERLETPGPLNVAEMWELLEDHYDLRPGVAQLSDGVEGMAWPDGRVEVTEETFRNALAGIGRARFTMAHEAYHGLRHRHQIKNCLSDAGEVVLYSRSQLAPTVDPEWQANQFAARLLMPTAAMQSVLANATPQMRVSDVMYYFKVSATAARIRINGIARKFEPPFILGRLGQYELPFES